MKKVATLLITFLFATNFAHAATAKPSPKPTAKASAKGTVKPSTTKSTAKSTTKKRIYKRYVRKTVKPVPSPNPKWPPANFTSSGSIYAKIPSADELKSFASNSPALTLGLRDCEKVTCGAVFLASESGCNWWQIDSMVTGPSKNGNGTRDTLGTIRTLAAGSKSKKIVAVLLKSNEAIQQGISVSGITARCWSTPKPEGVPGNTYTPVAGASASPSN